MDSALIEVRFPMTKHPALRQLKFRCNELKMRDVPFSRHSSLLLHQLHDLAKLSIHHPPTILQDGHLLLRPAQDMRRFLELELNVPKIDKIHSKLWLAGLPRCARPLHRQLLIGRKSLSLRIHMST